MSVTATPTNPSSVYELQVFTRTLTLSTAVTLLGYTVFAPSQSVILITISSTTLTISGYYDNIFNLQEWRYRLETNDSTEYTTSVYSGAFNFLYYKATGYRPDTRISSSIAINVRTSHGNLDFLHFVKNDWNQKRNRLLNFIRNSTIDVEERQIDIELDLPAGAIDDGGGGGGGGGAPTVYNFNVTLTTNTQNYDIRAAAVTSGWDQVLPLSSTITIANGVYVWSDSTSLAALVTGSTFPTSSVINIVNNGFIIGKGGQGGNGNALTAGTANGFNAGPALNLGNNITLTNNSYIAGGGGGGGGSVGSGGGGGAGGGQGGNNIASSGSGGAGGAVGASGSVGTVGSIGTLTRTAGGGGGGRILPGVGGTLQDDPFIGGSGGGAGGGGGPFRYTNPLDGQTTDATGYAGGSANNAATNPPLAPGNFWGQSAGGGGWGAAGGTVNQSQTGGQSGPKGTGGSGGKAIALNGYTVTYNVTGTIYGAVS
jgi:hypothetical protein